LTSLLLMYVDVILYLVLFFFFFFFQAEDGIRDATVTGVQTCTLPILSGLVGRLRPGTQHHQPHQMERTAEELSVGDPDRLRRCMGVGHRQVRLRQSGRTQTVAVARRATARVSAGCHGSVL